MTPCTDVRNCNSILLYCLLTYCTRTSIERLLHCKLALTACRNGACTEIYVLSREVPTIITCVIKHTIPIRLATLQCNSGSYTIPVCCSWKASCRCAQGKPPSCWSCPRTWSWSQTSLVASSARGEDAGLWTVSEPWSSSYSCTQTHKPGNLEVETLFNQAKN